MAKKEREYKTTTNRTVYNKLHKIKNASCSFCRWHGPTSENDSWTWYGGYRINKIKYPNWKLVSKNKKQWMKKPIKLVKKEHYNFCSYTIKF